MVGEAFLAFVKLKKMHILYRILFLSQGMCQFLYEDVCPKLYKKFFAKLIGKLVFYEFLDSDFKIWNLDNV